MGTRYLLRILMLDIFENNTDVTLTLCTFVQVLPRGNDSGEDGASASKGTVTTILTDRCFSVL
jgi:hypothetical protein